MNIRVWIYAASALSLGGCAAPDVEAPTLAPIAIATPTLVPIVIATPTAFPTAKPTPKPKPTVAPFKTKPAKGFSESQRRKIFFDLVSAEDRAREEADQLYSPYETGSGRANLDENERLTEKYKAEIIADYKLTKAQVYAIQDEGLDKEWPPLAPLKSPY